jgi:hypothetical protein
LVLSKRLASPEKQRMSSLQQKRQMQQPEKEYDHSSAWMLPWHYCLSAPPIVVMEVPQQLKTDVVRLERVPTAAVIGVDVIRRVLHPVRPPGKNSL